MAREFGGLRAAEGPSGVARSESITQRTVELLNRLRGLNSRLGGVVARVLVLEEVPGSIERDLPPAAPHVLAALDGLENELERASKMVDELEQRL